MPVCPRHIPITHHEYATLLHLFFDQRPGNLTLEFTMQYCKLQYYLALVK